MLWLSYMLLLMNCIIINSEKNYPKVQIPLGQLKGYYKKSENGRLYAAYEGIPYARPPIGELRFREPQKIPPWIGELQAIKLSDSCLQYSHIPQNLNDPVEGSEDCLYLNIYVPIRKTIETIPVLFWIHGGCFQYGAGIDYGAKYLADKDIILVTINYRLGSLGFLSTENEVISGNMGLKDQSIALRWVHENIEWFGGNSNKITLIGVSAGGVSVHYHYLSSLSAGLFQNGISFSGTALLCWAQTENPLEKAKKLGAIMGCPTDDITAMVECLRYRPPRSIVQATSEFMPWLYNPYTPFGPIVEKTTENYFINESPAEIITSGKAQDIPWITGIVSEEGLYPVANFISKDNHLKYLNDNWELVAPYLLDYNNTIPKDRHFEISKLIREHYFGSKSIDAESVRSLTYMVGDRLFVVNSEKVARMQAKFNKSPVWFYYYSYRANQSFSDVMSGTKENYGVSHADDVLLVLETSYLQATSTDDKAMQNDLLNFWVSVATNSKPDFGIDWPKVNESNEEINYLHISGPGKFSIEKNNNLGEKYFWNSIDFNENKIE
ncbi:PREDICTED: venom carboxylesterase-6-like, partial [Ceratosolen solmsi marchali]|uniref:Carboxylic ester hydrolase n=1 Tax=Ceratosolen solmsi marchali TaxID=326594 RepID=A0AAJ6VLT4_9HYME